MKIKIKLIIIILILSLVSGSTLGVYSNPTFSPAPNDALTVMIAKLLIAGGATYIASSDIISAVNHFWINSNSSLRSNLISAVNSISDGVVNISSSIFDGVKNYLDKFYSTGNNSLNFVTTSSGVLPGQKVNMNFMTVGQLYSLFPFLNRDSLLYQQVFHFTGEHRYIWNANVFQFTANHYPSFGNLYLWYDIFHETSTHYTVLLRLQGFNINGSTFLFGGTNNISLSIPKTSNFFQSTNFTYFADPIIDNLNRTFLNTSNNTPSMLINTNTGVNSLVGKSSSDILNEDINKISHSFPSSWHGTFSDSGAVGGFDTGTWTSGDRTDRPMVGVPGTWIGRWINNFDGTLDWQGTYSDSLGNTWQGTISGVGTVGTGVINPPITSDGIITWLNDLFIVGNAQIDWNPLLNIQLFSKFPFSIPWDFYNAVNSLNANPEVPRWELPIVSEIFILDFSIFNPLARIIRWGVLVSFIFSLILITRSLIKG